jgi:hypothetical protein
VYLIQINVLPRRKPIIEPVGFFDAATSNPQGVNIMQSAQDHQVDLDMAGRVGKTVLLLVGIMLGLIILANLIA